MRITKTTSTFTVTPEGGASTDHLQVTVEVAHAGQRIVETKELPPGATLRDAVVAGRQLETVALVALKSELTARADEAAAL